MSRGALPKWMHLLDEFCIQPDPMTWHTVRGLRISVNEMQDAMDVLHRRGFIEWAGVIREKWPDPLYRPTAKGRAYWHKHVAGRRKRPPTADPLPRYSGAKMAVATNPRSVFDLWRVPWSAPIRGRLPDEASLGVRDSGGGDDAGDA